MDLIPISCELPLPHPCGSTYKGIAFDGCHYYLTCPGCCEIVKYDLHFCQVETIKTNKPYTCICFDLGRNCFWAGTALAPYKLLQLDPCFREIDCISIPYCDGFRGVITAVSYDCRRNGLFVCCANAILWFCPDAMTEYELLQTPCSAWNTGAVSVAPSYLVVKLQNTKQLICVYDGASTLLCKYEVPCSYIIEAIVFSPCTLHSSRQANFYLLATKNGCYPYLLKFSLPCCEADICPCNYAICHRCCKECPPTPCPRPEDVCADLLESIALIEAALSHILNAEGEKLQKVISTTDDLDQILCFNKSVQETITKVTRLEVILLDKLATIKECCCLCEDDK